MKCCDRILEIRLVLTILFVLSVDCGLTKNQLSYLNHNASPIVKSYHSINTTKFSDKGVIKEQQDKFKNNDRNQTNQVWREKRSDNDLYEISKLFYGNDYPVEKPVFKEPEECILGKSDFYLWWLNKNYTIAITSITINNSMSLTSQFNFILEETFYEELNKIPNKEIVFLSIFKSNLMYVPQKLLSEVNETLQFLSLAGNNFGKSEKWSTFPPLRSLLEIDLRVCSIVSLKKDTFLNLPSLRKLFLSNNILVSIDSNAFNGLTNLIHLDISYNNHAPVRNSDQFTEYFSGVNIGDEAFKILPNLTFLDISRTKITQQSVKSLCTLNSKMQQLSLCYTGIPFLIEGMFSKSNLTVLDLSGNRILVSFLDYKSFDGLKETLKILVFKNSSLKVIGYFSCLYKLRLLDLSNNNINELQIAYFREMINLEILDLESNHISTWFKPVLVNNTKLKIINLQNNNINYITAYMMDDFTNVKFLALGNNKFLCDCTLRTFFEISVKHAKIYFCNNEGEPYVSKRSTEKLDYGNIADLDFIYEVLWRRYIHYIKSVEESAQNITQSVFDYDTISKTFSVSFDCQELDLEEDETNKSRFVLMDYNKESYKCLESSGNTPSYFNEQPFCEKYVPDNSEKSTYASTERTSTITIQEYETTTETETEPEYIIVDDLDIEKIVAIVMLTMAVFIILFFWKRRQIRYFCMLFKNSLILALFDDNHDKKTLLRRAKRLNSDKSDFVYDVFVSYSDKDREWILNEFLPHIERRSEINVCLHERNFQVGLSILENIISCMDQSRCLLLVISDAFLLSHWCQFEMHLAQHRLLETRREQLILVLLEDIPRIKRPQTLHYLMKTKTYIVWPNQQKDKKIFWRRLKKAIIVNDWEPENGPRKKTGIFPKTPRHSIV